jgi:hypothetical protein
VLDSARRQSQLHKLPQPRDGMLRLKQLRHRRFKLGWST